MVNQGEEAGAPGSNQPTTSIIGRFSTEGIEVGGHERAKAETVYDVKLGFLEADKLWVVLVDVVFDNHAFVRLAEATHIPGEHHKVVIRTIHGFRLKQPTPAEGSNEFLRDKTDGQRTLHERTETNTARFKGLRKKDGDGEPR